MGKLIFTHDTWAPGGRRFGEYVAGYPGVEKVVTGNVRDSHVSNVKRPPKLELTKHSIRVTFYSGGSLQLFYVFPRPSVPMESLLKKLDGFLSSSRPAVPGQSSKDEVVLPEWISRKMKEVKAKVRHAPGEAWSVAMRALRSRIPEGKDSIELKTQEAISIIQEGGINDRFMVFRLAKSGRIKRLGQGVYRISRSLGETHAPAVEPPAPVVVPPEPIVHAKPEQEIKTRVDSGLLSKLASAIPTGKKIVITIEVMGG